MRPHACVSEIGIGASESQPQHWKAELELAFERGAGRTRLLRRRQFGPLVVQRPFYPEIDGTCHVYLLHPPAGIAGGDELHQTFDVGTGARCVLTTPGATKFYRSASQSGLQRNLFNVGEGAVCEYLPQETILFDGARARIETRVTLAAGAAFLGWEFICFGRPAANENFDNGSLSQRIEIVQAGESIWIERFQLPGGSPLLNAAYAFAGRPVVGTMVYTGPMQEGLAERIRNALSDHATSGFSVSQLDRALVCRYLGKQAQEGKSLFARAWDVLRISLQSKSACLPRIWAT